MIKSADTPNDFTNMLMKREGMSSLRRRMCLASLLCLSATGWATDWSQWRGPNRDGVSTESGLLKDWSAGGPPLAWSVSGLGEGYASVSVSGQRIFTTGDKGDSSYVVALNLADGKTLWKAKLGQPGAPGWGDFA